MTTAVFDSQKAEAFAGEVVATMNGAAAALMISIGHRTGLFDAMRELPPRDAAGVAGAAGLNERYVREWLAAMTTAGVVEHDPALGTYVLPPEHAAALTRAASPDNLAVIAQFIPVLAGVEGDIVRCFRDGGGVPYSKYPRFHEVMAEESGQSILGSLESHVLPLVPGLADRLRGGIDVMDVGCGRGAVLLKLAGLFPASRFKGIDLSDDAITHAEREAAERGLTNVAFDAVDVSDFATTAKPAAFDFVTTFDAIHDQAKPLSVLTGIRRSLRPGGVYLMQEINGSGHVHEDRGHPIGTFLYTISCLHCMTVSLAQGGEGLGAMWGRAAATDYLARAGFGEVAVKNIEHDIQNDWYVARAG